jgi:signal transduction histidine kinase
VAKPKTTFAEKSVAMKSSGESNTPPARRSNEIRILSYLLHPPLLEDAGLGLTIRGYVEGFAKRSGISLTVDVDLEFHNFPQTPNSRCSECARESSNIRRLPEAKCSLTGTCFDIRNHRPGSGHLTEALARAGAALVLPKCGSG